MDLCPGAAGGGVPCGEEGAHYLFVPGRWHSPRAAFLQHYGGGREGGRGVGRGAVTDCLFCRIVTRELPGTFVFEDDRAAAFLDLFPVHQGHTLVVPRTHYTDLADCPADVAAYLFELSARLAPAIVQATSAQGFNVWVANGKAAGQEVFHLHLHILPRHEKDSFGLRFPKGYPKEAGRGELEEMAGRIRTTLTPAL